MKTFKDYLTESKDETFDIQSLLNESHDLSQEQEDMIDATVDRIMEAHKNGKGKTVGKAIAKVLGIQKGALYDLMTSRLVGAALGAVLGKRI